MLRLIRGPAPSRFGSPRLCPSRPPGAELRAALDRLAKLEARVTELERRLLANG